MLRRLADWLYGQAYLLLVFAPLFWGGNMVAGRIAAGHVPPIALAVFRWAGSALIILPIAWPHLKREWPVVRANWRYLVVLSVIGISGFNTFVYIGLEYTTAIKASLLQSSQPVLIAVWTFVLFSERLTARQLVGIGISSVGVIGLVTEWQFARLYSLGLNIGDLYIFLGSACYALYSAMLRRRPAQHWSSFLLINFIVGGLFLVPFWMWEISAGRHTQWDWLTIALILFVSIFPSILAYLCYTRGVQLVGPNRAGPFIHLVPVFGTLAAIVVLGEQLHMAQLVAFVIVLAGITVATTRARKPA